MSSPPTKERSLNYPPGSVSTSRFQMRFKSMGSFAASEPIKRERPLARKLRGESVGGASFSEGGMATESSWTTVTNEYEFLDEEENEELEDLQNNPSGPRLSKDILTTSTSTTMSSMSSATSASAYTIDTPPMPAAASPSRHFNPARPPEFYGAMNKEPPAYSIANLQAEGKPYAIKKFEDAKKPEKGSSVLKPKNEPSIRDDISQSNIEVKQNLIVTKEAPPDEDDYEYSTSSSSSTSIESLVNVDEAGKKICDLEAMGIPSEVCFNEQAEMPFILAQGMLTGSLMTIPEEVQKDDPLNTHRAKLGIHAFNLWVQSNMTDITVRVGNHSFQAHKAVLTCYCPFLKRNLLNTGVTDIQGVELHNITERAFEVLLTYMYTGKLKLTPNNIGEVYRASRLLQMKEITCVCADILSGRIGGILSILYLYVTSKDLGIKSAWAKAYKVLGTHFDEVVETFEFLELQVENLCEILDVNPIGASSEIAVFLAAIRWLDYRYIDREPYILEVMSCVRFPLMSIQEILACYHPPILPGNIEMPEIQLMLLKATCYIAAKSQGSEAYFRPYSCIPRVFLYNVPTLLWDLSMYDPFFCTQYDLERAALVIQKIYRGHMGRKEFAKIKGKQAWAAPIIQSYYRGFLTRKKYCGFLQKYKNGQCQGFLPNGKLYDPFLQNLLHFPHKEVSVRDSFTHVQKYFEDDGLKFRNQESILVLGGFNPSESNHISLCSTVYRYDPTENYWQKVAKMPVPRHQHKAVYYNNFVYIIGGCDPRDTINGELIPTRSCFALNVNKVKWDRIKDMKYSRMYHGVCVHDGFIYVLGGKDEIGTLLASMEIYVVRDQRWEESHPMCQPKMGMGVAAHKSFIWVAGGLVRKFDDLQTFIVADVETYDTHCKLWVDKKASLPSPRSFATLLSYDNTIYIIGGVYRNSIVRTEQLDSINDVLFYTDNDWKYCLPMRVPIHDAAVTAIESRLYVIGGLSTLRGSALEDVWYVAIPHGEKWKAAAPLPTQLSGTVAVALPALAPLVDRFLPSCTPSYEEACKLEAFSSVTIPMQRGTTPFIKRSLGSRFTNPHATQLAP